MATPVAMPQLGESVTEGTLARWLKQPGDPVARYESIAEVVTDKVNAEIPSPEAGTMGEHLIQEGVIVAVGELLCMIETGATQAAPSAEPATPFPEANPEPSPELVSQLHEASSSSPQQTKEEPVSPESTAVYEPTEEVQTDVSAPSGVPKYSMGGDTSDLHLTPIVRMLAKEHGVDLHAVRGTGIGGRISKRDVLDAVASKANVPVAAASASTNGNHGEPVQPVAAPEEVAQLSERVESTPVQSPAPAAQSAPGMVGEDVHVPLTTIRKTIAEHMVRSWHTSPHAWFLMEVDMSNVVTLRNRHKGMFQDRYGVSLTFMPFVAQATVAALQQYPSMNASWAEDGIVEHASIHLGIAVALEDNLIVPVIRNADRLSLTGLTTTMTDIAERARLNKLKVDEIQGGTFTLNNTGALGTVMAAPIINQPQAAILAMDRIVKRPVVVDGDAIAIRPIMNLCISFDHRLNDGLQASRFLGAIKNTLEQMDDATVTA